MASTFLIALTIVIPIIGFFTKNKKPFVFTCFSYITLSIYLLLHNLHVEQLVENQDYASLADSASAAKITILAVFGVVTILNLTLHILQRKKRA